MATMHFSRFEDIVPPSEVPMANLDAAVPDAAPGRAIFSRIRGCLCIRAKEGWIGFNKIYYGNKKAMDARGFYNGFISRNKSRAQNFVFDENS